MADQAYHNQEYYRNQLEREGFSDIRVRTDGPDTHYKPHTHDNIVAHIILEGHMRVEWDNKVLILHPGDRWDVPASVVHEAEIGGNGCMYMIGEKAP